MNSKELNELIQKNTRVILPEFGAFLVKESNDKSFNPSNVSFSPFLRYNDGMLEVYVAKSKGISKEEASKDVRQFVENIKNELQEKGTFQVESLGLLKRDQKGSLTFVLADSDTSKVQTDVKPSKKAESKPKVDEASVMPESKIETKKDVWEEEDKPITYDTPTPTRKILGSKAKVEKLTYTRIPINLKSKSEDNDEIIDETIVPIQVKDSIEELKQESVVKEESRVEHTEELEKKKKPEPKKNELKVESKKETENVEVEIPSKNVIVEPKIKTTAKDEIAEPKAEPKLESNKETIENKVESTIYIDLTENKKEKNFETNHSNDNYIDKGNKGDSNKKRWGNYVYLTLALVIVVVIFFMARNYYLPPVIESSSDNLKSIKSTERNNEELKSQDKIVDPKDQIDKAFNEISSDKPENKAVDKEKIKKEKEQEDAIKNAVINDAEAKKALVKVAEVKKIEEKKSNVKKVEATIQQKKNTEVSEPTNAKYHIIVGSFKNSSNADKFVENLKKKGHKPQILVQPSGMNSVSIGSFNTRDLAIEESNRIKEEFPSTWILKK